MTRIRTARGLVLGVTTLLAAGSLLAPAAEPTEAAAAATMETVFNEPSDRGDRDHRIESRLIRLIDGTPAGAQIDFSVYSWTRNPVAEALKRARERGVRVRIAIDGGADDNPANEPTKILKAAGFTRLVFCGPGGDNTACIANRGTPHSINHNKLWMFSKTGNLTDVVVVSSHNLTNSQGNLFNHAVIMSGDAGLYGYYRQHMDRMLAQRKDNGYFSNGGYHKSTASLVTTYMSPRADSRGGRSEEHRTDTYAQILSYVKRAEPGCALDIAQAHISDARTPVVDEIVRIARLGCKVRIVYDAIGADALGKLRGRANISLKRYLDNDADNIDGRKVSIHSKYMIYRGHYNETANRSIVFSGSHNLSGAALRSNDEILTKIENPVVGRGFADNFATIWSRAKCSNPKPGEGSCP
ncbi:Phosphatidylserine/phosphatidylglycerophosphate/cardiolipin synthase [Amycolatopsis arida]|uniref:phospholipase D n=1 Tax=Amycolatopsis arida TaxID=587909 RepID=A0A1I5SJU9_9PSEU|nr:phospholipase D-like domain-containing protein [Amycolatopsis arida]TDX96457.1 phosphatidylserine/phosphatidylglycerophosphate/cardiolipin synthase-like enzyme [Amycolatopsis arida]SFP70921.1 Phosphatidylserine/phosphatidylglycerophosphate/cardiolipin synthase [Amycolatopsis arida]